jgi:outer membrane receptor protein involved in Fe transport
VFRKFGKRFDMRLAGNYINTSNYFVTNTASIYYNGSYAYQLKTMKFYGAEFEFNWNATDKLVLFGNYSHLKNDYSTETKLPYAVLLDLPPRNKGTLSARYALPFKTRVAFDLKAIGERKTEGGYGLGRYAVGDISFERTLANRMTAGFFINNLFGMDYRQVYGFPSPGRTFGVRLQVDPFKKTVAR